MFNALDLIGKTVVIHEAFRDTVVTNVRRTSDKNIIGDVEGGYTVRLGFADMPGVPASRFPLTVIGE